MSPQVPFSTEMHLSLQCWVARTDASKVQKWQVPQRAITGRVLTLIFLPVDVLSHTEGKNSQVITIRSDIVSEQLGMLASLWAHVPSPKSLASSPKSKSQSLVRVPIKSKCFSPEEREEWVGSKSHIESESLGRGAESSLS